MGSLISKIRFYFKCFLYGAVTTGAGLYGVIASIILKLLGKNEYSQYTVARAFYYPFSWLSGVKITIKNEERLHQRPAVVISNHQSALDLLMLARIFQVGYTVTAKKALMYVPVLGWFMSASGTFFLDRSKSDKARKVLEGALKSLKRNHGSLFMFPEGTRSATKELDMLPFKKGAFHLAKQAGIPVLPCVVSNTSNIFDSKNKIFNSGEIIIEVLEPMSTEGLETNEDVTKFTEQVRSKMLERLQALGYSKTPESSTPVPSASADTVPSETISSAPAKSDTSSKKTRKSVSSEDITEATPLVA
ncbi:Piso0_003734 [Millerozyma farinosa CBS 7064]|uniref:1-acyl-sn-glycerol-3-phosphate acyltransferase n=1 Tax=Pichia sorbitophila (strain ATCC MYA-4447 / BCRC 22081 / CBS 7064 / NBRC 10061 / NRRL Y-12695) TaxID=559304 RepID=G8Y6G3_PICSO|nr:Piso0_003734 [Millerozyma farinosa CBS 7064]CCE84193.1 Piso0_003734 [Millerozyma farinosa CBS 7064]